MQGQDHGQTGFEAPENPVALGPRIALPTGVGCSTLHLPRPHGPAAPSTGVGGPEPRRAGQEGEDPPPDE